jgi:catechol 2,3-dioxygenase-like lactoylglutathione lyase family enzyme
MLSALPALAQLAPFNSAGVTIGHIHLNVSDMSAHQHFWLSLGGASFPNQNLLPQRMIQFPGIYIILREQSSTGGSAGSVIDHVCFNVKSLSEWLPKWKSAGLTIQKGSSSASVMLVAPDGIRVEVIEKTSLSTPIAMHHLHLFTLNPPATQEWYAKVFGAMAGEEPTGGRSKLLFARVLGAEFQFNKTDVALAPSKGRALDHIGFDVKNLDEFVKRLSDLGIQTEYPVRGSTKNPSGRVTHITDPWGMRIELSEGTPRIIRPSL